MAMIGFLKKLWAKFRPDPELWREAYELDLPRMFKSEMRDAGNGFYVITEIVVALESDKGRLGVLLGYNHTSRLLVHEINKDGTPSKKKPSWQGGWKRSKRRLAVELWAAGKPPKPFMVKEVLNTNPLKIPFYTIERSARLRRNPDIKWPF
jgi:hypothetical protein